MKERFKHLFNEIFHANGLDSFVTDENVEKFWDLTEIMLKTNAVMNITAITEIEKIIPLHYADCVKIANLIPDNAQVADIGCGGGFPILPLSIVRPDLKIVGIDSTEKKVKYVSEVGHMLGLSIETVADRAEALARLPEMRQKFDVVVSRAVARLNILDELCMPFVKPDGIFIAMKGAAGLQELDEASSGIKILGGTLEQKIEYSLKLSEQEEKRTVFVVRQNGKIDHVYPRPFANIKKKPL